MQQTSDTDSESGLRIIGSHTPGYPVVSTSGSVLASLQTAVDGNSANAVVDPMKYLREFNYGKVSKLSDGKALREFTLVASDNLVKEVSPGVFYNVWTFNGTVPGPTRRATEGDIVRINFVNNGSMSHSLHLHGVHPANMDGVFEMISPWWRVHLRIHSRAIWCIPIPLPHDTAGGAHITWSVWSPHSRPEDPMCPCR